MQCLRRWLGASDAQRQNAQELNALVKAKQRAEEAPKTETRKVPIKMMDVKAGDRIIGPNATEIVEAVEEAVALARAAAATATVAAKVAVAVAPAPATVAATVTVPPAPTKIIAVSKTGNRHHAKTHMRRGNQAQDNQRDFTTHEGRVDIVTRLQKQLARLIQRNKLQAIASLTGKIRSDIKRLASWGFEIGTSELIVTIEYPMFLAECAESKFQSAFALGVRVLSHLELLESPREQIQVLEKLSHMLWRLQSHTNFPEPRVKLARPAKDTLTPHDLKTSYHWMMEVSNTWLKLRPLAMIPLYNRCFWNARLGYMAEARKDFLKLFNLSSHTYKRKFVRYLLPHVNQHQLIPVNAWIPHELSAWMTTLGNGYRRYGCAAINSALTGKKMLELAHVRDVYERNQLMAQYLGGVVNVHADRICEEILCLEDSNGLSLSNGDTSK